MLNLRNRHACCDVYYVNINSKYFAYFNGPHHLVMHKYLHTLNVCTLLCCVYILSIFFAAPFFSSLSFLSAQNVPGFSRFITICQPYKLSTVQVICIMLVVRNVIIRNNLTKFPISCYNLVLIHFPPPLSSFYCT